MNFTYLLVNFLTIIIPFLFSFHPKLNFHKTWGAFFPAVFISGIIFIAWDIYFTHLGIWGFNPRYLVGVEIFNLPIEEILFFFCIPYACVFTYHCLDIFMGDMLWGKTEKFVTLTLIILLLGFGMLYFNKLYTVTTFLSFAALLAVAKWVLRVKWLGKFYVIYAVLLIPFFLVNGVLTGTGIEEEVVWYNSNEFMNFRIGTIPVEDTFYGMELILLNLLIYKYILSKRKIFA
ncbi:lycopene cyclase domain-containing protein [Salinimicrobium sp. GXAS 041]|uniref:lycopene cyclase domain-containing protein n=1 Tax=Salinimicrobium sp. GXAS 041 TaxID=3400806 RepID=UPI003C7963C9